MNKKWGYICDKKSQKYPLNRQGKGSLLLPCPKMPIGILLFALKSDFQKSGENGVKVGVTLRVLSPKSRRSRG